MVGDEWPRRCSTIDRLQDGRLDFKKAFVVEKLPYSVDGAGAHAEHLAHVGVGGQVYVALTVAFLDIAEAAVGHCLAVNFLRLDDGQRTERLCQHLDCPHQDADFARLRAHHCAVGLHEIAQVKVALEHLVGVRADLVLPDEKLDAARAILNVREGNFACHAHRTDTPAHADLNRLGDFAVMLFGSLVGSNGLGSGVCALHAVRVGFNAARAQTFQLFQAFALKIVTGLPGHDARYSYARMVIQTRRPCRRVSMGVQKPRRMLAHWIAFMVNSILPSGARTVTLSPTL